MLWRSLAVGVLWIGAFGAMLAAVRAPLFDLDRFSIPKELAVHVTALLGLALLWARRSRIQLGVVGGALAAFATWSIASAVFATNHWLALRATALTVSGLVVFGLTREATLEDERLRRAVVFGICLAALAAGATGLAEAYGWAAPILADTRAPGGLLGNRNFLAHLLVLALPLVAWLILTSRQRAVWILGSVAVAGMAAAIVLSRSRAAWVGLAAETAIGLVAVLARRSGPGEPVRSARVAALLAGAVAGLALAVVVPNQLAWKSSTPYRDSVREVLNYRSGSGRGRLIQFENSLRLVAKDPVLGTGPGNWVVNYPLVTTPGDPSYNGADPMPTNPWPSSDWVALVSERGPAGALLFGTVLVMIGVVSIRRLRHADFGVSSRAAASLALAAGAAVMGLFDAVLLLAPPVFLTMAGLGALLPHTRPIPIPYAGRLARAVWFLVLVVIGAAATRGALQLAAMLTAGTGAPRSRLEAAVRLDPSSYRLRVLLALRAPCPAAAVHAGRAAAGFPHHSAPRELARRCGHRGDTSGP